MGCTTKSSKTNISYQGAGRFMKYNQIISLLKSNADTYLFILPFSLFILIKIIKLSESLLTKNLQSLRKNKDLGKLNKVVISKSSSSSKKPLKPNPCS